MAKILLVLATTPQPQVAGQPFGGKRLFKFNEAAQISDGTQVVSDDLVDGDYVASCQSLDANGAPISDSIFVSFTLAAGQIVVPGAPPAPSPAPAPSPDTYDAPAALSVSVVPA